MATRSSFLRVSTTLAMFPVSIETPNPDTIEAENDELKLGKITGASPRIRKKNTLDSVKMAHSSIP